MKAKMIPKGQPVDGKFLDRIFNREGYTLAIKEIEGDQCRLYAPNTIAGRIPRNKPGWEKTISGLIYSFTISLSIERLKEELKPIFPEGLEYI